MKIKNLTSEQWKLNHEPDHDDKWCRELYPFHVFEKIDFDSTKVGKEQRIKFNQISYYAEIINIELQPNERYKSTFELSTVPTSKRSKWKYRSWNTTFQIVYSQDFDFITVFTKKKDPSKDYVVRFMKGNYQKITDSKSLPISELLLRTLILHLAEENYPNGENNRKYKTGPEGLINLTEHKQFKRKKSEFAPIYSQDRDLWICYSFTEEKAHRIAYHIANQTKELIVVFCNPTYTRHHRCTYVNTSVLSLFEFANLISPEVRKDYESQIRFLQNHLNEQDKIDAESLLNEIEYPTESEYPINKSELMEALGIIKIIPTDDTDLFHSLACVNLINAFLSRERKKKSLGSKERNLFRNMYYFKTYLQKVLTDRIGKQNYSAPIYIERDLILVEINGFQFSFHNVPMNDVLKEYERSIHNKEIIWNKKRLQPLAPLLLKYSRLLKQNKKQLPTKPKLH